MDRGSLVSKLRPVRREAGVRYRKWSLHRTIPSMPTEAIVPLDRTPDVLLLCSRLTRQFQPQTYISELAFAREMAARGRVFATADDPSVLFEKSVLWFLPGRFVHPELWNYSRQAFEFAVGLERQGNRLLCSSDETAYWENKAHMHRKLSELGIPTPKTRILTSETWRSIDFDMEPVLIKKEHSAGSSGILHFATASEARRFVMAYAFRPTESLIMQEVVRGASRDMRITIVGDKLIEEASYWRVKSQDAGSTAEWTSTATTYNSLIDHTGIPKALESLAVDHLRRLGVRTAGIDFMWVDDDFSREPLVLEFSPYYQPNPPKPDRYRDWTYKQYKQKPYVDDGYLPRQYLVFRRIAAELLDQGLY